MKLAVVLGGSYVEAAQRAARLGFDALVPFYDANSRTEDLPGVRRTLAGIGVEPVMLNAYTNLVHPHDSTRASNIHTMQHALRAAAALGCRWVNTMAGTRDPEMTFWAYHPDNFGHETWQCLVDSVHRVLDGVPDVGVGLTLEPYMLTPLSSAEKLAQIVAEINSPRLRIVLDPVNLIPPGDYYRSAVLLQQMFDRLGSWIVGAHAKDHYLQRAHATVHIDERIPGQGELDYAVFVRSMAALPGAALIIEHLREDADILAAKQYICAVADQVGVKL
jgi:sugar phosphate isomerase/epimerase